jgi:hypothetical protein
VPIADVELPLRCADRFALALRRPRPFGGPSNSSALMISRTVRPRRSHAPSNLFMPPLMVIDGRGSRRRRPLLRRGAFRRRSRRRGMHRRSYGNRVRISQYGCRAARCVDLWRCCNSSQCVIGLGTVTTIQSLPASLGPFLVDAVNATIGQRRRVEPRGWPHPGHDPALQVTVGCRNDLAHLRRMVRLRSAA